MNAERFASVRCPVGVRRPVLSASGVTSVSDDRVPDDLVSDDRTSGAFWGTQTAAQRRFWERGALSGVPSGTRIAAGALIQNRGLFRHVSEVVGPASSTLNEGGAAFPGWAR